MAAALKTKSWNPFSAIIHGDSCRDKYVNCTVQESPTIIQQHHHQHYYTIVIVSGTVCSIAKAANQLMENKEFREAVEKIRETQMRVEKAAPKGEGKSRDAIMLIGAGVGLAVAGKYLFDRFFNREERERNI